MIYTIDRFEGEFAVLLDDNKRIFSVKKEILGEFAEVGNVFESDNLETFEFLEEETKKRKLNAVSLHRSLFNRAKRNK